MPTLRHHIYIFSALQGIHGKVHCIQIAETEFDAYSSDDVSGLCESRRKAQRDAVKARGIDNFFGRPTSDTKFTSAFLSLGSCMVCFRVYNPKSVSKSRIFFS